MRLTAAMKILALLIAPFLLVTTGCFRNTPEKVAKRFVLHIKDTDWNKMIKMVDWDSSEKHLGNTEGETKRDIITNFAEVYTRLRRSYYSDEELRHKLLYMSVESAEVISKKGSEAEVKIFCKIEQRKNERKKTFHLKKVRREWKIVLTPNLFQYK